jgi:hypothetical protein
MNRTWLAEESKGNFLRFMLTADGSMSVARTVVGQTSMNYSSRALTSVVSVDSVVIDYANFVDGNMKTHSLFRPFSIHEGGLSDECYCCLENVTKMSQYVSPN